MNETIRDLLIAAAYAQKIGMIEIPDCFELSDENRLMLGLVCGIIKGRISVRVDSESEMVLFEANQER